MTRFSDRQGLLHLVGIPVVGIPGVPSMRWLMAIAVLLLLCGCAEVAGSASDVFHSADGSFSA